MNERAILHYPRTPAGEPVTSAGLGLPGDPLPDGRSLHLHDIGQGYAVGGCDALPAHVSIESYPWVELSVIEAGELTVEGEGYQLNLRAGDCFVVPKGAALRWHHAGPLRRVFMAFPGLPADAEIPARVLRLDPALALAPCDPPAAEVLLTPAPAAWSQTLFNCANLRIGLWACEPYARKQVKPGYSELMYILEGSVTLTAEDGPAYRVAAGEVVMVPAGATNAWVSTEAVRKVFCILSE